MKSIHFLVIGIAAAWLSAAASGAQLEQLSPKPESVSTWPLENVRIEVSPRVLTGSLENGLRYAVLQHASSPGRASLRLLVRAGSLHEADDEQGYAHFVEHMAFNGTKRYAAGELVKFLERQGAQFGPHANATTTPTRTVYKLDIPDTAPATLETSIGILRDFADGILFQPVEVKRERGVIHAEDRTRRTPESAEFLAQLNLFYAGTRIPSRNPIGLTEHIEKADARRLKRFYDAWYRPERMHIIVVGDVNPHAVEEMIQQQFASLAATDASPDEPDFGRLNHAETPAIGVHLRQTPGISISLASISHRPPTDFTWGQQLEGLKVHVAVQMIRDRLSRMTSDANRIINEASHEVEVDYVRFRRAAVRVAAAPIHLNEAMALVEQEVRRAVELGFNPDELALQQNLMRTGLQSSAAAIPTTPSSRIADLYVDYAEDGTPYRLVDESIAEIFECIDQLTVESCRTAVAKVFSDSHLRIFVSCAAPFAPSIEKVRAAYAASRAVTVKLIPTGPKIAFAYEDFGTPGTILARNYVPDLDLWQMRLSNDVRLNLKPTDFEKGQVRFTLRVGYGKLTQPAAQPGLALWFPFLWYGGTGRHSYGEMRQMHDGLDEVTLSADDDAFVVQGWLPSANLPKALRQLTALIGDPGFRAEGWEPTRAILRGAISSRWLSPQGVVDNRILPLLGGGDSRLGIPSDAEYNARTADEFRAWVAPQLATGPVEFSLVGDFDVAATESELEATLGTLRQREPRVVDPALTRLNLHRDRQALRFYYHGTSERPSRLEFFWRIQDPANTAERVHLEMLARIFANRVETEIREKRAATYYVAGGIAWRDVYPEFSFIRCSVDLKSKDLEKQGRAIRGLALALAKSGISDDELARIKAQAVASARSARIDNSEWLGVLSDSNQRPERLERTRNAESDAANATVADLNQLATRYLGPDRVFHYFIDPDALRRKTK